MTTQIVQRHPRVRIPTQYINGREVWWDEKVALIGLNLDTTTGRIGYDYTENGVFLADNARYDVTEQISITTQLNHDWLKSSNIRPHIHWMQSAAEIPNMLLGYRLWENGATVPASFTIMGPIASGGRSSAHVFTYSSGTIGQITTFGEIDLSAVTGLSPMIQFKIWRDTGKASSVYATTDDPLTGNWLLSEFDYHYRRDSMGSRKEVSR